VLLQQQAKPKARKRSRKSRKQTTGSVGVSSRARNLMRPMRATSAKDGHMCRFRGTDFLTAVTIDSKTAAAAGDILINKTVNPKTLGISRLATASTLWERYKFKSLKFRYAPVAPTTAGGSLLGYVDYDTYDDITGLSGDQNLQRAAAHFGEKPTKLWEDKFWEIKDVDPLTDLYIDTDGTDPRWTNQGRFLLLANSAIPAGTACGNIYLDYDVEFFIPQLELTPTTGFGNKYIGGGSQSSANLLGDAMVLSTWNNIPITRALNVFSLPAGSYTISLILGGTVLATTSGVTSTGTVVTNTFAVSASATALSGYAQIVLTAPGTFTLNMTGTTVTSGTMIVALLPSSALTMTQRKVDQLSRMLSLCGEVKALQSQLNSLTFMADHPESIPEAKECKLYSYGETASMSAMASMGMGSTVSKIPQSNEDYYVVPKRGNQTPLRS